MAKEKNTPKEKRSESSNSYRPDQLKESVRGVNRPPKDNGGSKEGKKED